MFSLLNLDIFHIKFTYVIYWMSIGSILSLCILQEEAKEKYIALAAQLKEKHGVME